ncbi:MAG TPA: AbrB/MazE/SpoVT family DNA-binding domain-containing protein [Thermodesulfobacteriota bacterium]|nr:AbrB/MazE/SpoVT family DNA-binding domain-containing protein [Thermodesulfobacteriota bacterium]
MTVVRTRLIKIGNSQGLRIPKVVLEQLNLSDEVELEVQENQLVVRPVLSPRSDWEEQFKAMAAEGDDQLLDEEIQSLTTWDEKEWEW